MAAGLLSCAALGLGYAASRGVGRAQPALTEPDTVAYGGRRINVGSYDVYISQGLLHSAPEMLLNLLPKTQKFVVITDENLWNIYGRWLESWQDPLSERGKQLLIHKIVPGERWKTRATKAQVEDWMLATQCGRDTCIVAFGGGVVGDLGGFVAATYMRGIPCIQFPTSFLAMVDSSVGGKTGLDTPAGKNLVGAFHRPTAVFIDPTLLKTLPGRELCNGMAESIKAGAIYCSRLFSEIENNVPELLACKLAALESVIAQSVAIKAQVVLQDEREGGMRAILNFGHTVGHAIEALMQPKLLHGECVAIGMVAESELSRMYGTMSCQSSALRRLVGLCEAFSLPTRLPQELLVEDILKKMVVDKKNRGSAVNVVMLRRIGEVVQNPWTTSIDKASLRLLLSRRICVKFHPRPATMSATSDAISVQVPGSKSLSNRILILAALAAGTSRISGLLHSEDTQVMLAALRSFGVQFDFEGLDDTLVIQGAEGHLSLPRTDSPLFMHNAGTASRFLTTLCTLIKDTGTIRLEGNERMHQRPISDLVDCLEGCGAGVTCVRSNGCLPVDIKTGRGLPGGTLRLSAGVSSQFVSSVLLSAPYAAQPVTLELTGGAPVSEPYINMTLQAMKNFGVPVHVESRETGLVRRIYRVPQRSYISPGHIVVEGDASAATYPLAFAAVTGRSVCVTNVGSASLQGDAQFAGLLARMGCTVQQTHDTTTVHGPTHGHLQGLGYVDMDTMTDSFMTLAAVAATATGVTTIGNVANQRVKECNRIGATVDGLQSLGINVHERPDGLEVKGLSVAVGRTHERKAQCVVACHEDHRLAMSFAILGCTVGGVVVDDKNCVNKTYPQFWDMLQQQLGATLSAYAGDEDEREVAEPIAGREYDDVEWWWWKNANTITCSGRFPSFIDPANQPTVFIVGMRGSGKTTLGKAASASLGRPFIDLDHLLEARLVQQGNKSVTGIKSFVDLHGWPAFRQAELEVLKQVVAKYPNGYIVACGGGIVETQTAADILASLPLVVEVQRDIDDIVEYLQQDNSRPSYGQQQQTTGVENKDHPRAVYERRRPLFDRVSNFVFRVVPKTAAPQINRFRRFLCNVAGVSSDRTSVGRAVPSSPRGGTFFLSLTFPTLRGNVARLTELTKGVDAVELRVDLLRAATWESVEPELAVLHQATHLPVIFTVRSRSQGGAFPDDEKTIFELLHRAVRAGVEFVDMETHWGREQQERLLQAAHKSHCGVIASVHVPSGNGGGRQQLRRLFEQCYHDGRVDYVKVVTRATCSQDAVQLLQAAEDWQHEVLLSYPHRPLPGIIVLAMGSAGQVSRVLNKTLTPVTHELLPKAAAPGQMSVRQILGCRTALGLLQPKQYFVFGHPISKSPSPNMHNTAFSRLELPHQYSLFDTTDASAVAGLIRGADFGGASVTIPLKEAILPLLDVLSPAAKAIGACNTIVRTDHGLLGDNTDWLGIARPLAPLLAQGPAQQDDTKAGVALVVGAGGTARAALFALQQLGYGGSSLLVFNRTYSRAVSVADQFSATAVKALEDIVAHIDVVVCTVPGDAGFTLPTHLLKQQPVVFDVTYLPRVTPLLAQAKRAKCATVSGIDMIIAQGVQQMDLWTGGRGAVVSPFMDAAVRDSTM